LRWFLSSACIGNKFCSAYQARSSPLIKAALPPEASLVDRDLGLSFEEGFDPISALKSLSNPASPAVPAGENKSGSKRPRQSLFASAIMTVQEQEGKRTKAS